MGDTDDAAWLLSVGRRLSEISGVAAIVLGGSRATGTSAPHSDYDLGLYYEADNPLDTASLTTTVRSLDGAGPAAVVTPIGGWGPWINGGG